MADCYVCLARKDRKREATRPDSLCDECRAEPVTIVRKAGDKPLTQEQMTPAEKKALARAQAIADEGMVDMRGMRFAYKTSGLHGWQAAREFLMPLLVVVLALLFCAAVFLAGLWLAETLFGGL